MAEATKVNGFILANPDKVTRALQGAMNERGEFIGGVQKSDGSFDPAELIAEYDKIGGLILKGEDKVRTGSFYDIKARKARAVPKVEFEFRVNGEIIYVPAEAEKPNAVKAVQIAEKAKKAKKEEKETETE
jgi:hypothetical protein